MDNYRDAYGDSYKAESCERWAQEDKDVADYRRAANEGASDADETCLCGHGAEYHPRAAECQYENSCNCKRLDEAEEVCPRCKEETDNDNRMVHTTNRRTGEAVHACELCIEGMESDAQEARLGL